MDRYDPYTDKFLRDTQYDIPSTNLAEVGTNCSEFPNNSDAISRQAAIDAVRKSYDAILDFESDGHTVADSFEDIINALPSAQPDIIRCWNCKFASGDSRICMKFGHSPIGELDFCAWAERRTDE